MAAPQRSGEQRTDKTSDDDFNWDQAPLEKTTTNSAALSTTASVNGNAQTILVAPGAAILIPS
jgi:hypothetical protein